MQPDLLQNSSTHRESFRLALCGNPFSGLEGDTLNPLLRTSLLSLTAAVFAASAPISASAQTQQLLTHHVRRETETGAAKALGQMPAPQTPRLPLTLPLRNQPELDTLLDDLYNP